MRYGVVLAVGVGCLSFASSGTARSGAGVADLQVIGALGQNTPQPAAATAFSIFVSVFNNGPDPSSFTLHVDVPAGVEYERQGSGCTGTTDLVCAANDPAPVGDDGSATVGDFFASAPGTYVFTVRLTDLGATDPNLANNTTTVAVTVGPRPMVLVPLHLRVAPTHPRAGRTFTVSFDVLDKVSGKTLAPSSPRCRVSIGHARARVLHHRATCVVTTPSAARGRSVSGVLSTEAVGKTVSRAFSVRLR